MSIRKRFFFIIRRLMEILDSLIQELLESFLFGIPIILTEDRKKTKSFSEWFDKRLKRKSFPLDDNFQIMIFLDSPLKKC